MHRCPIITLYGWNVSCLPPLACIFAGFCENDKDGEVKTKHYSNDNEKLTVIQSEFVHSCGSGTV